jgi:hypothetical protein
MHSWLLGNNACIVAGRGEAGAGVGLFDKLRTSAPALGIRRGPLATLRAVAHRAILHPARKRCFNPASSLDSEGT